MEFALNLEWLMVALAMCWCWVRYGRSEGPGRPVQLISLALVLVMMFVVIAMYDDIEMAQNPVEARCFQREDDFGGHAHPAIHPVAALAPVHDAEPAFHAPSIIAAGDLVVHSLKSSILSSIENRPPPIG